MLDHRVDDVGGSQEFALQRPPIDIQRHGLQQVAACNRGHRAGNGGCWPQQIIDQGIDGTFHVGPGAVGQAETNAGARLAFMAHHFADVLELLRDTLVRGDDGVERIANLARDADFISG
ncbi:hypothetical protein [Baekduia sp.]|uniref:hypothetical protein n=1 Tax=Baekduia sp. TaxID=2600305 RepID=UPI002E026023|nr:hypothetical protein [Baekduia sp.]